MPTTTARRGRRSRVALPGRPALRRLPMLLWLLPAATAYAMFVLYPLTQTVRYSLYDWNGIGQAVWVGAANYITVLTDPTLYESLVHTVVLIVFFSFIPIAAGLVAATFIRDARSVRASGAARTILFLPQIVPLAAAAIAWTWLADFDTALPAVGLVGSWAMIGFCTVLFLAGIGRIDVSLYEAARLDGASGVQEFFAVTLPGLRHEILVCATVTLIGAIASFDLVYMMTGGGPGFSTMVPGVQIVRLAFTEGRVGLASALAVVLLVVVLLVVLPLQRLGRER
jgi:raffinose/stachyose/melibiose transport system permease protein